VTLLDCDAVLSARVSHAHILAQLVLTNTDNWRQLCAKQEARLAVLR
jgi:hypothetical protein